MDAVRPSESLNVYNVDFEYTIKIWQKFPNGVARCSLTLHPEHYSDVTISQDGDIDKEGEKQDLKVEFSIVGMPGCVFDGDAQL